MCMCRIEPHLSGFDSPSVLYLISHSFTYPLPLPPTPPTLTQALQGTGPGGRIVAKDLDTTSVARDPEASSVTAPPPIPPPAHAPGVSYTDIELTNMRKVLELL